MITLKMADHERSAFYVVFTRSLCALKLKTTVNKFAISNHTALILGVHALRSHLKPLELLCATSTNTALKLGIKGLGSHLNLTSEYESHILSNTQLGTAKDHGENYRSDCPWSASFSVIVCWDPLCSVMVLLHRVLC